MEGHCHGATALFPPTPNGYNGTPPPSGGALTCSTVRASCQLECRQCFLGTCSARTLQRLPSFIYGHATSSMPFNYFIEVAVAPNTTTTERGRILERFARSFLETQNYNVQEEVRLTASEVDLLGTDKTTAERIFVEWALLHKSRLKTGAPR